MRVELEEVGDDFGFGRVVRKAVDGNGRDARWAATSAAAPATGKMPVVPVGRAARRGRLAPPFRHNIHPFRAVILLCGTANFGKRDVYCRKPFTMRQHDLHVLHVLDG